MSASMLAGLYTSALVSATANSAQVLSVPTSAACSGTSEDSMYDSESIPNAEPEWAPPSLIGSASRVQLIVSCDMPATDVAVTSCDVTVI